MSRKRKSNNTKSKLITIILILVAFLYGSFFDEVNYSFGMMIENASTYIEENIDNNKTDAISNITGNLKIYYLDVGQADSILIENNHEYMLIDAGNNNDGALLVKYFESLGINKFKYVVGTHPHEDHIGGLDDIIDSFDIDTIYLPDIITTTDTFYDVLKSIDKNNMTYEVPKIGSNFNLGDASIEVIYTGTDTNDLNNTSIVLKMVFGNTSYLFTGDATDVTEEKIIKKDIKADVLKVGHHGSKYSSTDEFLEKVDPEYAIISVGKNNKYDHPSDIIINKFKKLNIKTYRTDKLGTILLESDGKSITITNFETNTNGG